MVDWILGVIGSLGYPGAALLMFLENVFPPIPSEVVMPLAGVVASRGQLNFWGVVVAGTLGSVLGALPLYYIGARFGLDRLKRWADEHGKWLALSGEEIDHAKEWFDRHGAWVVFFGRLVPGVRSLISIPAGADRMPLPSFLLYTTGGAAIWTGLLAYAGVVLGQNFGVIERYLDPIGWTVFGLLAVLIVYRIVKAHRQQGSRRAA